MGDAFRLRSRATAGQLFPLLLKVLLIYRGLVVFGGLALLKTDCARRADRQTVSQTVAVVVTQKLCLAVYNADCPLVAGIGAQSAAVALFFIYFDNFSNHFFHSFKPVVDFMAQVYYAEDNKYVGFTTK